MKNAHLGGERKRCVRLTRCASGALRGSSAQDVRRLRLAVDDACFARSEPVRTDARPEYLTTEEGGEIHGDFAVGERDDRVRLRRVVSDQPECDRRVLIELRDRIETERDALCLEGIKEVGSRSAGA